MNKHENSQVHILKIELCLTAVMMFRTLEGFLRSSETEDHDVLAVHPLSWIWKVRRFWVGDTNVVPMVSGTDLVVVPWQ